MADASYPNVYIEQGANRLVVGPNAELLIEGAVRGIIKGRVFYVDSAVGSNSNDGTTWSKAVATIDYAVGLCTAGRGDVILVAPGHAETITAANAIDLDVAGITVQGLGTGTLKPTITFGTATTATVRVNAANVTVRNLRFVSAIDSLALMVNVNEQYCTIEDCAFVSASTVECLNFLALATTYDYLFVRRCRFEQPTDPTGTDGGAGTGAFYCVDSENILFDTCWFIGNFETAIFHNRTTACKHLWVINCFGIQALSGAEPFQLVAGATGGTVGGGFITPAETAATEATLCGTVGDGFFFLGGTTFGNDGGAGGQGGIAPTPAS